MDFFRIKTKHTKNEGYILYPTFVVGESKDLMIRSRSMYAVWDEEYGRWSRSEIRVQQIVDDALFKEYRRIKEKGETDQSIQVRPMSDFDSKSWQNYKAYLCSVPDNYHELNRNLLFSNSNITKDDYASFTLSYPLLEAPCPNYDLLMSTLYDPEERDKLEWAIGSIIAGDSKLLSKFIVIYGDAGSGKSTFLKILYKLFEGYCATFESKALADSSDQFSLEPFKDNPLVAIDEDGDLSRTKANERINKLVSHEPILINEKFKSKYTVSLDAFLFIATNSLVKVTDANAGMIRRLIDVSPSGRKLSYQDYIRVMSQLDFELSGIAWHCLQVYNRLGKNYYDNYRPYLMMDATDHFFTFMSENYFVFKRSEYITVKRAWNMYKEFCDDFGIKLEYRYNRQKVETELRTYYRDFYRTKRIDGEQLRRVFVGFRAERFAEENDVDELEESGNALKEQEEPAEEVYMETLTLNSTHSEIDILYADCLAQYATTGENEIPLKSWSSVKTKLKDLDTTKTHYILFPDSMKNHIVVDFDLKDENGNKSSELNLKAAMSWPLTYAEYSKGGAGIHLHYIYDGDPGTLSMLYAPGIEIKVFNGKSSLRRRLSYCNDLPVAHISSGLPLKEVKRVVNFSRISSEKKLRELIERNLHKEIHPATKPSIDFIYRILEDAYNGGELVYDIRDMRNRILSFAMSSTHQSDYCLRLVAKMHFQSEVVGEPEEDNPDDPIVFYDVEVFPNFFLVCWKYEGDDQQVVRMFNPSPEDIERLMKMKLVGFNSRVYDSHILYARYLGYTNLELYKLSKKLVSKDSQDAKFRDAYNIGYTDVYDFAATKQGLKKWEIELGIHHKENAYPWDDPLPEDKWNEVADYCANDVVATEKVFNHLKGDFIAREILADLAGGNVNMTTNSLTERIIFNGNKHPKLIYTHLDTGVQE